MKNKIVPQLKNLGYFIAGIIISFSVVKFLALKDNENNRLSEGTAYLNLIQTEKLIELNSLDKWMIFPEYHDPKDVRNQEDGMIFSISPNTNDEWAYLFIDPKKFNWTNISWEFKILQKTHFREFAFNFRYFDFDNRYRYRFEDDRIYFDKKFNSFWSNNIASISYSIELEKEYDVRIDVYSNLFRCFVNKKLVMENVDTDIASGSVAIILWENDGETPIVAEVSDLNIFSLTN